MSVIDPLYFLERGGYGCTDSNYRLYRTTCCDSYAVGDDELDELYIDPVDLKKRVSLGYSPRHGESPPRCPFCGAAEWRRMEIKAISEVPEAWRWAAKHPQKN